MRFPQLLVPLLIASSTGTIVHDFASNILKPVQHTLEYIERGASKLKSYLDSGNKCSQLQKGTFDHATSTISSRVFCPNHFSATPYIANGYFGQALPAEGVGYWTEKRPDGSWALNGWPLDQPRATFGTIAGFWNLQEKVKYPSLPENVRRGGESVISGIPDWTGLILTASDGQSYLPGVDASTVLSYQQSLSLQNGIVQTNVTWKPKTDGVFQLNFTAIAHRSRLNLGLVRLDVTIDGPAKFTITDVLDGAGASRAHFGDKEYTDRVIWTSVKPWGIEKTTAYVASIGVFEGLDPHELELVKKSRKDATSSSVVSQNLSTIAQSWDFDLTTEGPRTITIFKHAGIASSDAFPNKAQYIALKTASEAADVSWSELLKEHDDAWDTVWGGVEIEIPDNEELQILVRGSLYHLLANSRSGTEGKGLGDNSILVGGLSSDSYAGLVFWDSDVWMHSSLLLLHPDHAMSINNYRDRLLPQAIENAQSYGLPGLLFPWTSGRFGNCTGTGLCKDYQYHLDHDIAQAHWNYFLHTGNTSWLREIGWPIIRNAADMFANYVQKNPNSGKYESKLLGEPDEYAYNIDNGAYTNSGIKLLLGTWAPEAAKILGYRVPRNWSIIAENIEIPYDENADMILEYEGMDGLVNVKQASVVLINYPLGWNINDKQAQNDMAFYSAANTADGPAMTWSIFSINSAQLDEQGCAAYSYLIQGSEPYLRAPFYQFSEQQTDNWYTEHFASETNAAFPFLTAYGGILQVFTHGFTGIRPQLDALLMDPMMVPQFPSGIKVKGVKYQGAVLDISIGPVTTTIYRQDNDKSSAAPLTIRIRSKTARNSDHILHPGETLVVPTRRPDLNGSVIPGNLAQCIPAVSNQLYLPGRLPMAAVDGSNATLWQPASPAWASLIVDLGEMRVVSGVSINWGPTPPARFRVMGSETRGENWKRLLEVRKVDISAPYCQEEARLVISRLGNITEARFEKAAAARFISLEIIGTQGNNPKVGATVAEFAVV